MAVAKGLEFLHLPQLGLECLKPPRRERTTPPNSGGEFQKAPLLR